jgi:hypothetical protein
VISRSARLITATSECGTAIIVYKLRLSFHYTMVFWFEKNVFWSSFVDKGHKRAYPAPTPNFPATCCGVAPIRLLYVTTSTRPPARERAPLAAFAPAFRYNLPGPDTTSTRGYGLTRALPPPPPSAVQHLHPAHKN